MGTRVQAGEPGKVFPRYRVPGFDTEMQLLEQLHRLHHPGAFTNCTLWDRWLPHAALWPAVGEQATAQEFRQRYRDSFLRRRIDAEGYVSMQQHRGMAHSEGWPFPAYQQSSGVGWHFSTEGEGWAIQHFKLQAQTNTDGWEITGAEVVTIDPKEGLKLHTRGPLVTLVTPPFACGTIVAPFIRLEWAAQGLAAAAQPAISWQFQGESDWKPERLAPFPPLTAAEGMQFANVPLYRQKDYVGLLTRLRMTIPAAEGARITLKSLITAVDTRHPITNINYLRGCSDYFLWTGDIPFLQQNLPRMRQALQYTLREFAVRENRHVVVPWVGHDGRSGLALSPEGKKTLRTGLGVGNNYWDLLPFGGH
ncbi:MAG TPA: hypothetical protein PKA06_15875, partial [Gemmatales bacterium]|nr:hypothetical protein [Gemmatales bacterium]